MAWLCAGACEKTVDIENNTTAKIVRSFFINDFILMIKIIFAKVQKILVITYKL